MADVESGYIGDPPEGVDQDSQEARLGRAHEALLEAARSRGATNTWITREGEEFHITAMHTFHLRNAQTVLKTWVRQERRESKRRELRGWLRAFAREIRRRDKEWQKKRVLRSNGA